MEAATRVARLCSDLAAAAGPRLGSAREPALTTAWQRLVRCHRHVPVLLVRPHDARAHARTLVSSAVLIVVKHENHTPIGSFKVRGGLVYFDRLKGRRPQVRGIVT